MKHLGKKASKNNTLGPYFMKLQDFKWWQTIQNLNVSKLYSEFQKCKKKEMRKYLFYKKKNNWFMFSKRGLVREFNFKYYIILKLFLLKIALSIILKVYESQKFWKSTVNR